MISRLRIKHSIFTGRSEPKLFQPRVSNSYAEHTFSCSSTTRAVHDNNIMIYNVISVDCICLRTFFPEVVLFLFFTFLFIYIIIYFLRLHLNHIIKTFIDAEKKIHKLSFFFFFAFSTFITCD